MARWTVREAILALKNRETEAREDIGRTCPLFVTATNEEILEAIDMVTTRQVESRLRELLIDEREEEIEPVEEPKKRRKRKTEEEESPRKRKKRKTRVEEAREFLDGDGDSDEDDQIKIVTEDDDESDKDMLDDIFDDE